MKINRTCCNALIGTEQEQINQLYEFVKALAGNYFEGFEIMGTYSPTVNYNKKYMLVFFEGSTYVKTVDGDSVNFSPALNPDKWALFSSGTPAELSDLEKVIKGTDTVVVDVNEDGTALEIHADYETIVKPLARALKKPVSNPTETVLAGVDEQGEQVLLPVSSVGGGGSGVKVYRHSIQLKTSDNDPLTQAYIIFFALQRFDITSGDSAQLREFFLQYENEQKIISPIYLSACTESNPNLNGILFLDNINGALYSSFVCFDRLGEATQINMFEYSIYRLTTDFPRMNVQIMEIK